jgi:hypothetical protein
VSSNKFNTKETKPAIVAAVKVVKVSQHVIHAEELGMKR